MANIIPKQKPSCGESGIYNDVLSCKAKRQYLLDLQVGRYCLLAFQSSIARTTSATNDSWMIYHDSMSLFYKLYNSCPAELAASILTHLKIQILSTTFFTDLTDLLCKTSRQYLLTCKVSRYCLLALNGSDEIFTFMDLFSRFLPVWFFWSTERLQQKILQQFQWQFICKHDTLAWNRISSPWS